MPCLHFRALPAPNVRRCQCISTSCFESNRIRCLHSLLKSSFNSSQLFKKLPLNQHPLKNEDLDLIREAWTKYTNELESGQRYGNRTLTYGKLLTPGGMRRKLHQWAKKPSFRERLVKLGYLKA